MTLNYRAAPDAASRRVGNSRGGARALEADAALTRANDAEVADETLLAVMAQGDERAAVAFVRRYQRRIFGLAFGLLHDATLAEDVAQETFLRVWRHAPVFDARRASASTWVRTIARNLAIDAMRLRRANPAPPEEMELLLGGESSRDEFEISEAQNIVREALRCLPREQQRALVLSALYGRTAAEVAEAESIPLGTAKSRIRIGLLKLQSLLGELEGSR